jgi:hypothetical protein
MTSKEGDCGLVTANPERTILNACENEAYGDDSRLDIDVAHASFGASLFDICHRVADP